MQISGQLSFLILFDPEQLFPLTTDFIFSTDQAAIFLLLLLTLTERCNHLRELLVDIWPQFFTAAVAGQVQLRLITDHIDQLFQLFCGDDAAIRKSKDLVENQHIAFLRLQNLSGKIQAVLYI